jgi:hypothetical protein
MLKVCFCAKQVDSLTASESSDFDVKNRFHKTSHTVHILLVEMGAGNARAYTPIMSSLLLFTIKSSQHLLDYYAVLTSLLCKIFIL